MAKEKSYICKPYTHEHDREFVRFLLAEKVPYCMKRSRTQCQEEYRQIHLSACLDQDDTQNNS